MKIKNIIKKLSVVSMALVMAVGLASCGGGSDVLKVGMEPTFAPFDTTDENGDLAGFDVDFMNAIAEDQGFEIEFVSLGFDGLIPALKSDNIDIVASGMWANEEREKEVDFSTTYYDSGLAIAVKEDNTSVTSLDSIPKDAKVAAQVGTSSADFVQQLADEGKIAEAKIYDKVTDAIQDLKNGTVVALINDKPVTQEYMSKQPGEIKIVGETLNKEAYGIAVKEGNKELLDKINAGIENLKANGKYDELLAKWNLK